MRRIMPTLRNAAIVGINGARTGYRVLLPGVFDMRMRAMGAADVIDVGGSRTMNLEILFFRALYPQPAASITPPARVLFGAYAQPQ